MPISEAKKKEYFNFPNFLTLLRILLIPVVVFVISRMTVEVSEKNLLLGLLAAFIFLLAAFSDLVDGYYARKFNINSAFGKNFDPLADKMMVLSVMIMLIPLERIPAWMVVLFLFRELAITALRSVATAEGMVIAADRWGKRKTLLQNLALTALLIHQPLFGLNSQKIGIGVLWLALLLAVGSGFRYAYRFWKGFLT